MTSIFHIIGIGNKSPDFSDEQLKLIASSKVFSGGNRHFELVKSFLPVDYCWIEIKSPLENVFDAYDKTEKAIIVFASGNPLFYGFANTIKDKYPKVKIVVEPYFSSIQILVNKTNTNSNLLQTVSVHGRSWKALDSAIIRQLPLIGVLTDTKKSPDEIAKRLLNFGYSNYDIIIGEDLEGAKEKIQSISLEVASTAKFHDLNCVLLKKKNARIIPFGIKETDFKGLKDRPNMVTKMPIRLTTMHLLEIEQVKTLWDIGFCTGSISIEAKLRNPEIEIVAFEKRLECEEIISHNQQKFGAPGIETKIGDFFEQNLSEFTIPEAVFIGGHGGKLKEMLQSLELLLPSKAIVVINAVQNKSIEVFRTWCNEGLFELKEDINISLNLHNPIRLLKAIKV